MVETQTGSPLLPAHLLSLQGSKKPLKGLNCFSISFQERLMRAEPTAQPITSYFALWSV